MLLDTSKVGICKKRGEKLIMGQFKPDCMLTF